MSCRSTSLLFLCSLILHGQSNLARVGGTITDPSAQAISGAEIRVKSVETQALRAVSTDGAGVFEVPGLSPGEYIIEIQAAGFAVATRNARLEVGQNMRLDLALTIGEAKTSVDVTGMAETLKT